jgi:hypothetical protein
MAGQVRRASIFDSIVEYRSRGAQATAFVISELHSKRGGPAQPQSLEAHIRVAERDIHVHGTLSAFHRFLADEPYALSLSAEMPGFVIGVSGEIESPATGRGTHLELNVRVEELKALAELFGLELHERGPLNFHAILRDTRKGYLLDNAKLGTNASDLTLRLSFETGDEPLKIVGRIDSFKIDLGDVVQDSVAETVNDQLFSEQPLELSWLHKIDVALELNIDSLVSTEAKFSDLKLNLRIADGELNIDGLSANVADGPLRADLSLDDSRDLPVAAIQVELESLVVGKLPFISRRAQISNGITDISLDVKGSGRSIARIAGNAGGEILIRANDAVINHGAASVLGGDLVLGLLKQLNPLAQVDSKTHLGCLSIRFRFRDGIARDDTGIGLRTRELTLLGGGTIDLKTERIDIGVKPKPRTGVGLNLTSLADFIRIGGTLKKPEIITNAAGAATAGLKVGAGVATVGLSVLAEGLFDRLTADTDACSVALGTATIGHSRSKPSMIKKTTDKTTNVLEDASRKVKGVFKSLFDN